MSEQNQAHFNEDDSNSNANLAFCTFCNGNGKELMNELKLKVATLEAKNQLFEATNKHLEEKLKHFEEKQIQEKKYTELEAKMRNLELMQKMEHLEADFTKKLAILEEQLKSSTDLVTEGNANKAILEKLKALKDAIGKAEENIQKNQQKIGEHFKEAINQNRKQAQDIKGFEEKLKEAEQKAQMANNKLETTIQGIQKKMENFAVKEKTKADEQSAGGLSFGMRGGSQGYFSGRGRGGFAKDDELSGGSRGGMRGGSQGGFGSRGSGSSIFRGRGGFGANTEENHAFGATAKEAEQKEKAQMANNKKKMEDFAAKETTKDDDLFAGVLRGGMRGGFGGRGSSGGFVPIQPVGNKGLGATSKEAEQKEKAQMANNKLETTIQGIQQKMEDSAAKKVANAVANADEAGASRGGMQGGFGSGRIRTTATKMEESAVKKMANADEQPGGSRGGLQGGFGSGRIRIRLDDKLQRIQKKIVESAKKMANDDEQPGGLSLGMRGGFGGRGDFDGPPVV